MTQNWTRREWSLVVKTCALILLFSLFAAPARSQMTSSQYFPPVAELLGEPNGEMLPTPSQEDLRDSIRNIPTFKSDIRALHRTNPARRKEAARRLGTKGNTRAIPYLGAILLKANEDVDLRSAAALSLGSIGGWKTMPYFRQAIFDSRMEVRFASALALGRVGSSEALELLSHAAMRDTHWWIRYSGAVALGETNSPAAIPPLKHALREDLRWQVRQQAARSLGQIGGQNAIGALGEGLKDRDPTIRFAAARALGQIGGLESLALLHDAYEIEKTGLTKRMLASSIKKAARLNDE